MEPGGKDRNAVHLTLDQDGVIQFANRFLCLIEIEQHADERQHLGHLARLGERLLPRLRAVVRQRAARLQEDRVEEVLQRARHIADVGRSAEQHGVGAELARETDRQKAALAQANVGIANNTRNSRAGSA